MVFCLAQFFFSFQTSINFTMKCSDSLAFVQSKRMRISDEIGASGEEEIPDLPEEIITDILARLPVKCLLKFRCVSKSWLSLISSSGFIKAHLNYSKNNPTCTNQNIMLTLSQPRFNLKHFSAQSLMYGDAPVASEIDYPRKSPHRAVWNVGSCNGIVCIALNEKDIYLLNPAMGTSKRVPRVDVKRKVGSYYIWGFGYNECDDDYKVVGIFCVYGSRGEYESTVMVYSLRANSWRRIADFNDGIPLDDSGKYASGKLHFAAGANDDFRWWNIVSIDLESEEYGMVQQPDYGEGCSDTWLGVLGGCICVLSNCHKIRADVWVMKEYGVKESWSRVVSIPYVQDPGRSIYSTPLLMMPNGEVLLVFGTTFIVYNPKDNTFRHPETTNVDQFLGADLYVESLISPRLN